MYNNFIYAFMNDELLNRHIYTNRQNGDWLAIV